MDATFEYVFPSIRGVQAGREYYVSMCPLHLIPKIFLFNEEEVTAELRAQRTLNKARVPQLARYILDNPKSYIFSALTASIDGDVKFDAIGEDGASDRIGSLRIPMSARFLINDGQHRRAAIETAIRENPDLADETIAVVFFLDVGLQRCQQMFADLNRYSVRATRSIGILYDHRDERGLIAKEILGKAGVFREVVEFERSTLSPRSKRLFTLSAIYTAINALVSSVDMPDDELIEFASEFWDVVWQQFPEWEMVRKRRMPAGEVRAEFIHSHGVALHAIARVGNHLLKNPKRGWQKQLKRLGTMDWRRTNTALWEGRAMIGGRVSKAGNSVVLTTTAIKSHLGLPLTPEEQRAELAVSGGRTTTAKSTRTTKKKAHGKQASN